MKQIYFRPQQIIKNYHQPTRPDIARVLGSAFYTIERIEHQSRSAARVTYQMSRERLQQEEGQEQQRILNHIEHIITMWDDSFHSPLVILTGSLFDFLSLLDGYSMMGRVQLFYGKGEFQTLLNPQQDLQEQFSSLFYGPVFWKKPKDSRATPVLKKLIAFIKDCCLAFEQQPEGQKDFAERLFQFFFQCLPGWQFQLAHPENSLKPIPLRPNEAADL